MSDTARTETVELEGRDAHGHGASDRFGFSFEASIAGAAAFADAETLEILNLLGDDAAAGSCCGGSCCTPAE